MRSDEMLSPEAALEIILNSTPVLGAERVPLAESLGRVLAEDVYAHDDLPPFDNSAMDGYAVIADDTAGASRESPCALKVVAEGPAGTVLSQRLSSGQASTIMTGAPVPPGADAVVIVEDTERRNGEVLVYREAKLGANIRRAGEDVARGQLTIPRGKRIRPAEMGMLASLGYAEVAVHAKPRAAIITSGDELVDAAAKPAPGQIRNGNQYSLMGSVLQAGAEVSRVERVGDAKEEVERALRVGVGVSDLVIVCGGVSVGDYDYVKEVLNKLGEMRLWRVAIKPGKPLAYGHIDGKLIFGLPGNPVSCIVTFDLFVRPAISRMMGAEPVGLRTVTGVLTEDCRRSPGRLEYIRAVTTFKDGGYRARPIPKHGSGMLSSMVEANSYVVVPATSEVVKAGETLPIVLFE